jgi:hypothetical protein
MQLEGRVRHSWVIKSEYFAVCSSLACSSGVCSSAYLVTFTHSTTGNHVSSSAAPHCRLRYLETMRVYNIL